MTGSTGRRTPWEDFMTRDERGDPQSIISRRTFAHGLAVAAGATVVGASRALAQQSSEAAPPTTITNPPRDFGPGGAPTTYFWDPDIIAVDPSFNDLAQPTRRSSASIPDCCGPKVRPGARRAAISCGATFPTIGR